MSSRKNKTKPVILAILDGWGVCPQKKGNAIALAKTPNLKKLYTYPNTLLGASGRQAGLPPTQDGNSEAGHMNIGAGRIVEQDSVVISKSINDGTFFKNAAFSSALHHAKKYNSAIHLMGLLTNEQSAHADPDHLLALLTLCQYSQIKKVFLHLFTDGRDSYQYLAVKILQRLKKAFHNNEKISTIIGRFYAMDRIKEWSRTEMAYNAIVLGQGIHIDNPQDAILEAYNRQESDEYIKPTVIGDGKSGRVNDFDSVIFFNLRSDRVRQLCKVFVQEDFIGFKREKVLKNMCFVTLTDFGPDLPDVLTAYPARILKDTLPFILKNRRQLYIAENEKYAHVTYFFNGGYDHPVAGEDRVTIPSPRVSNYKEAPKMSASKITNYINSILKKNKYDFIVVNYANADMVGHSGDLPATIKAVETIDRCLGDLMKTIDQYDGTLVITADHGNAEEVVDVNSGQVDTSHSSNPVPFIIFNKTIPKKIRLRKGVLADIAPTLLHMMKIKKPNAMGSKILCQYQISQ